MATLINPLLFSKQFSVSPQAMAKACLFDPILNSDSKLFIDPLLISSSSNKLMSKKGYKQLRAHLSDVIKLITASRRHDDPAWKAASKLLSLRERPETSLGYGGSSTSGSSRSAAIREQILTTAKEIVELGENDPEIISLMGLFEDGVGPDTISDLTTDAIMPVLCEITEKFCRDQGIPGKPFPRYNGRTLPPNPLRPEMPVVLAPADILRDLPLAADWSDVAQVVLANEDIREAFNRFVGIITKATVAERKHAIRSAALESIENFKAVFSAMIGASDHYDPKADPLNLFRFREIMNSDLSLFKQDNFKIKSPSAAELKRVVAAIIEHFRTLIEQNNLWELLWEGNKPKRERAAQLVFFAAADMFCKANDIDIAPETNTGGGPVDFRFSKGYNNRVLVEVKLSKGRVVHGYSTQLRIYQAASATDAAILLIVNVGGLGKKLVKIKREQERETAAGRIVPDIEMVDGRRRKSASERASFGSIIDDDENDDEGDDESDEVAEDE